MEYTVHKTAAAFDVRQIPLLKETEIPWTNALATTVVVGFSLLFVWTLISGLTSPLRKFPGPWWAQWSNLWRFFLVRTGKYHQHIKKLHEIHGPVVRIGPKILDLDIPELAKTIYGTDGKWAKTEFYQSNSTYINGKLTYHLFSEIDQGAHARMKRPVAKYYSQSYCLRLEPLMDTFISEFCGQLDRRFANEGKVLDLGQWLGYYSWDLNGSVTFSDRFGYMDVGKDFDESLITAEKGMLYFQQVGQMPWLDFLQDKNPIMPLGPPNLGNMTRIALEHFIARVQRYEKEKDKPSFEPPDDYLQSFLSSKLTHPDTVDDNAVMGYLLVNVIAGADTTAITLRGIFYNVLRTPGLWDKLQREVRSADIAGMDRVASYSDARKLPYLEAVIRESMRLFPAIRMLLERYVPPGGFQLPAAGGGEFIPGGTTVGLNPYVVHRNKTFWAGSDDDDAEVDANTYRPERWLRGQPPAQPDETEEDYAARKSLWDRCDLTFGGGSRICIGRNLAMLEVYKAVATLVSRYDMELEDSSREVEVLGSWLPGIRGLRTRLRARKGEQEQAE